MRLSLSEIDRVNLVEELMNADGGPRPHPDCSLCRFATICMVNVHGSQIQKDLCPKFEEKT